MCNIEMFRRLSKGIKGLLGPFSLAGQDRFAKSGGLHAPDGRPCRWLGFVASGKSKPSLAICWILRRVRRLDQGCDRSLPGGWIRAALLGVSIPADSRERLTFLIRASGGRIPVVCITDSCSACNSFVDATIRSESLNPMQSVGELMANWANMPAPN